MEANYTQTPQSLTVDRQGLGFQKTEVIRTDNKPEIQEDSLLGRNTGRRLSLPDYPLGRNRRNGSMLCTSPDNSRYARRIFPSTLPVVVPSPAAPNRTGNSDIVVPAPIRPGNSDGAGGP